MKSIFDIVNVSGVTTEKALEIIDSLSPKQILEQDRNGNTILHMLAPAEKDGWSISFNLEQVVNAIVAKNAEVLNLRLPVVYTDPKTNEAKIINGDNTLEASIRHNNLKLLKILAPNYKNLSEFKVFDYRAGEQRKMTPEEKQKTKEKFKEPDGFRLPTIKILDIVRESVSPLAFTLRHGQFEMFKYLFENGFGEKIKGIEDRSKYNLDTKEGVQELYKDLLVAGNKDLLKELHTHLGYYEGQNGKNSEELVAALRADDKEKSLKLISQGHYVYDFSGFDCFYKHGDPGLLKYFLLNNFNHPNYKILAKDINGYTPLHLAAADGNTEVVKLLLEKRADMTSKNRYGNTPLHLAACNGHTESVKAILAAVKDTPELLKLVVFAPSKNGYTPLHEAASIGDKEILKEILEAVKDTPDSLRQVLAPDINGETLLDLAKNDEIRQMIKEAIMDRENTRTQALQAASSSTSAASSTALAATTAMPTPQSSVQVNSSAAQLPQPPNLGNQR